MSHMRIGCTALLLFAALCQPPRVWGQGETAADLMTGSARRGEVTANDVYVRSGPSMNHYTVTKLNAGARVTVVGEEGEWYEIAPPEGTFSLISGDYVEVAPDGTRGVINGHRVRVRAGSQLNDNKYTVQTMLDKGAEVSILGRNPDGFLRIHPPKGATLWISKSLVALPSDGSFAVERTSMPSTARDERVGSDEVTPVGGSSDAMEGRASIGDASVVPGGTEGQSSSRSAFGGANQTPARRKLDELDAATRVEMAKPMGDRRFDRVIEGYAAVAADPTDELAQRYAEERVRQLRDVQSITQTIHDMRRLSEQSDSARREFLQSRAAIPTVVPGVPSGLDAQGTLRESALYPPDRSPRRYRLVDETAMPPRTIAYVDLPTDFAQPLEQFLNRRIGLRAVAKSWQEGSVEPLPIYMAGELVLMDEMKAAPERNRPDDGDTPPKYDAGDAGRASPDN